MAKLSRPNSQTMENRNMALLAAVVGLLSFAELSCLHSEPAPTAGTNSSPASLLDLANSQTNQPVGSGSKGNLVPLRVVLPPPALHDPSIILDIPTGEHLEAFKTGPRAPLMVPRGVTNLSLGLKPLSSDPSPEKGSLQQLTNGEKKQKSREEPVVLAPGKQWVQIELGRRCPLYAIVFWHSLWPPKVVHAVIVQVADDADFKQDVRTLFNNDHANRLGFGIGQDREYFETFEGKLVEAGGAAARYVRLYSAGSSEDERNTYLAVEVYGLKP